MGQSPRASLNALTGSRFLAAYWVVAYHFVTNYRFAPGEAPATTQLPQLSLVIISQGHLAVDFFFLLSGFILAYTYVTPDGKMRGSRREFWVARIARIYPVYALGLLIYLPVYLATVPNWLIFVVSAIGHAFMIHAWMPGTLSWNGPSWSLSVEAFFYALFPLLLPLSGRLRRNQLWLLFVGSWLALIALDGALVLAAKDGFAALPFFRSVVRYNPVVSLPVFIAGMALGLLFTRYGREALPLLRRISGPMCDVLIIGALFVFGMAILVANRLGISGSIVDTLAPASLPSMAVIIFLLAFQRGVIAWFLSRPVIVWLGEISYAVYILHDPLWAVLGNPLWLALRSASMTLMGVAPGDIALFVAYSALVVVIAGMSFQFFERPLRRAIRMQWGRPRKVEPIPAFPNMLEQAITSTGRDRQG
ncbi:MAG TPA: acyltransferase [Ktedonobacterales bacterium]|nr:acyltransferase [Ktedonobacterales bacterium]